MSQPLRLNVDRDRCCGFGACVELAPEVFRLRTEDGLAEVVRQPPADSDTIGTTIRECPTEAIAWQATR